MARSHSDSSRSVGRRRLRHIVCCTAGSNHSLALRLRCTAAATEVSPPPSDEKSTCVRPLTKNQLKRFIRDGFIVLQIDGVPDGFHDQVYSKALEMSEDAKHAASGAKIKLGPGGRITAEGKQSDWSTLAEDFETLLNTPCIRGAATSLAGPGCLMPSVGAPSPLTANPFDQQFHKDGTATAVREPYPRSVSAWYYPHETTVIMGPTAVVPGSHLFGVDRDGFPHSEERIDLRMTPPKSREEWQNELLGWNGHALSIFGQLGVDPATGDLPVPERERRIAEFKQLLGPTFKEHKLIVPAGSVVIKHNDIVHRRCRSGEDGATDEGVEWRPMFGFSWTRTMEPTPSSLILSTTDDDAVDPFALTPEEACQPQVLAKVAVWESVLSWMQGNGPVTPTSTAAQGMTTVADLERLGKIIHTTESETERVGTAYKLGSIIRNPGSIGDTAMDCLLGCMISAKECVRRAATWGIGSGGDRVVPTLLDLLADAPLALPPVVRQAIRTNAGYALRVAVETMSSHAIDVIEAAMSACEITLTKRVAQLSPQERDALQSSHDRGPRGWDGNVYSCVVEMHHEVHELRKTIAISLLALGQLGYLGMNDSDSDPQLVERIWMILKRMKYDYVDEAAIFPTHLQPSLIRSHADRALCTMLCPNATSTDVDMALRTGQKRETGRGLGLAELALERLRSSGVETPAAQFVIEHA